METQVFNATITGQNGTLIDFLVSIQSNLEALGWQFYNRNLNKIILRQGSLNERKRSYLFIDDELAGYPNESKLLLVDSILDDGVTDYSRLLSYTPLVSQSTNGILLIKSSTNDTTARDITLIATPRTLIFALKPNGGTTNTITYFGDYKPLAETDYPQIIIGKETYGFGSDFDTQGSSITTFNGHYMTRVLNSLDKSVKFHKSGDTIKNNSSILGGGGLNYPNPVTGQPVFTKIDIHTNLSSKWSYVGEIAGVIAPCHNKPFNDGDVFSIGSRQYKVFNTSGNGQVCIETSSNWEV